MKRMGWLVSVLCTLSLGHGAIAQETAPGLSLANIFNDHMVLQREKPLIIWGQATAGAGVTVTLSPDEEGPMKEPPPMEEGEEPSYSVEITYQEKNAAPFEASSATAITDADGRWQVEFAPLTASFAPKALTVSSGGNTVSIRDVLIGEVWVTAGQSNMAWGGNDTAWIDNRGLLTTGLRYAHSGKHSGYRPAADLAERSTWMPCTEANIKGISTIPHLFGRYLHKVLRVPVGIINAASGGAEGNYWASSEELHKIDHWVVKQMMSEQDAAISEWEDEAKRKAIIDKAEQDYAAAKEQWETEAKAAKEAKKKPPKAPTFRRPSRPVSKFLASYLYNGRIAPIGKLAVRGAIYLQGEQQVLSWKVDQYEHVLPAVVRSFRTAFQDEEMPFGIISLQGAAHNKVNQGALDSVNRTAAIRDIQWRTHLALPGTGFICSHDVGRGLHPNWKRPTAERAAYWALRDVYKVVPNEHPSLKGVQFNDGKAYVSIVQNKTRTVRGPNKTTIKEHTEQPLKLTTYSGNDSCYLNGFLIAGADRKWYPAKVLPNSEKNALEVWCDLVPEPVALRYGWGSYPQANVGPFEDPLPPFRTDDWPLPRSHGNTPDAPFVARDEWIKQVQSSYDVTLEGRIHQGRVDAAICELKRYGNAVDILKSKTERISEIVGEIDPALYAGDTFKQTDVQDWLLVREDGGRLGRARGVAGELETLLKDQEVKASIEKVQQAIAELRKTIEQTNDQ